MATCEELAATIAILEQALLVDDAAIEAAQNIRTTHQLGLWFAQYNFFLQGCGGGGGGGSGSGFAMVAEKEREKLSIPARRLDELLLIKAIPELRDLHERAERLGAFEVSI